MEFGQIERHQREQSDGEKYLRWRNYQATNDKLGEQRVLSTLSQDKRLALKQLQKHRQVAIAFKKLESYRGLWEGFILGRIRHVLSWHCDAEICSYLERVLSVWQTITCGDHSLARIIDGTTVTFLQSRCPRFSREDQEDIREAVNSGKIFAALPDDNQRRQVLDRTLSQDGVILTIHTFFNDSRYLEAVAYLLKPLLHKPRNSLRSSLKPYFCPKDSDQYVEVAENVSEFVADLSFERRFTSSYLQLCLQAIRGKLRHINPNPSLREACLVSFAELSQKFGFDSAKLREKISSTENLMQCGLLRSAAEFKTVVAPVSCQTESEETLLALFHKTPSIYGAPSFSDDDSAPRTSFQCDPNHVFLPTLQRGPQGTAGRFATAYCLLYNVIFAFFGKDLRTVAGLSVAEISKNLRRHDEEQAPPLSLLQRERGRNISLDGELVSPSGLLDSKEEQDFTVHREVSSLYSQSPLISRVVSPTNDVERIRTITRKFASSNDVAFIKLETIEMKVASPTLEGENPILYIFSFLGLGRVILHF